MNTPKAAESNGRDFYDAQGCVGDPYFMYVIDEGQNGGGTSCYFWFSSPSQMLDSIRNSMDFWQWRDGYEDAAIAIAEILDSHPDAGNLGDKLRSKLSTYMRKNAGCHLWAWGPFEDLCSSPEKFYAEARSEFREKAAEMGDDATGDMARPISKDEIDDFCDYLAQTPT